jgi:hypothetical protein
MFSNISYYFVSRQKLNAPISQIEAECNLIFNLKKKTIAKIVKNASNSIQFQYNPGEKINYSKFKFDKDKVLTTKIPEDIAFYFLCRFQSLKDVKIIKQEVDKLFNNKKLTINEFEDLVKLFFEKNEEEFEQLKQKCDGLESSILDKNKKFEKLVEKCSRFENQINQTKSTEQDLINKLLESQSTNKEMGKNFENLIKKLNEFETNLLKEREVNADHLNEKNNKIKQLESGLKELQEFIKVCENINKELQIKHDDIKLKNDQLKLEIQRNENNSETNFFNQVVNRRSEIILQQKIDLETENNLLKEQINQYLLKNQACKDEKLQQSQMIDDLREEKILVVSKLEQEKSTLQAEVNERQLKINQLNRYVKTKIFNFENATTSFNIKLNQTEQLNESLKQEKSKLVEENKILSENFENFKQLTSTKQKETDRKIIELELKKCTLRAELNEKVNQHDDLLKNSNMLTQNLKSLNEKIKKLEVELKEADKNMKIKDESIQTHLNKINKLESINLSLKLELDELKISLENEKKTSISALNEKDLFISLLKAKNEIEIKLIQEKNIKLTKEIENKNFDFYQIQESLKKAISHLEAEKSFQKDQIAHYILNIQDLNNKIQNYEDDILKKTNMITNLQEENRNLNKNLNQKENLLNEAKILVENNKNQINELEEINKIESDSYHINEINYKCCLENLEFKNSLLNESSKSLEDLELEIDKLQDSRKIGHSNMLYDKLEDDLMKTNLLLKEQSLQIEILKSENEIKIKTLKENHEKEIASKHTRENDFKSLIKNLESKNYLLNEKNKQLNKNLDEKDSFIELAEKNIKNLTNEIKDKNLSFNQIFKLVQPNLKNEEEQSVITTEISLLSRSCFKRKSSIETMNETNESKVCVFFFPLYK